MLTVKFVPSNKETAVPDDGVMTFAILLWSAHKAIGVQKCVVSQENVILALRVLVKRGEIPHEKIEFSWQDEAGETITTHVNKDARYLGEIPPSVMDDMLMELLAK